jgi:hypothetical protein
MCRVSTQITGSSAAISGTDQPLRQRTGLDPDPPVDHAERGQKRGDIGRLSRYFLLQDHRARVVDNAYRRFLHRHIKTDKMRHLIAPSSMPEAAPTSIHHRHRRDCTLIIHAEPQPPRYTILAVETCR